MSPDTAGDRADGQTIPDSLPRRRSLTLARLLKTFIITLAIGYVAACLFVALYQKHLMYFPDRAYAISPADLQLPYETVSLTASDGVRLSAWFIPREHARSVVLLCNGNGGNMSDLTSTAKTLWLAGYSAFLFDYRGYGRSEGEPDEAGIYLDARAAWTHLVEKRHIPPRQIIIFGHSLGGAVAIDLASKLCGGAAAAEPAASTPAALIAECTFTRMSDVGQREYPFLPVSLLCTQKYDSLAKIERVTSPKLFLHGRDDELVPIDIARRLFAAAPQPKELIETPGTHNNSGFQRDRESTKRVLAWLDATLPPP